MLIVQLALRNVRRNTRRSFLTALMITAGTALLIIGMSWVNGVLGNALEKGAAYSGHIRVVTPKFALKEQLFPIEENMAETDRLVAAIAEVPGVVAVYPRIQLPVTVTANEEIGENFALIQGAPTAWMTEVLKLDQHLVEGRMPAADDEAIIGLTVAEQTGGKVGGELVTLGQTQDGSMSPARFKIVGTYDLGSSNQNRIIFSTLEKARYIADIPDGATEILVYTADREVAVPVAAAVNARTELAGLEVRAWSERSPWSGFIGVLNAVKYITTGVVVFITALGVFNTMLMSVMERTAEIGVLRAMGLKTVPTVAMFVVEAFGIATVGGLLGAAIGGTLSLVWLERMGINLGGAVKGLPSEIPINAIVYGDLTVDHLVTAFLLGLLMALAGAILPAIRATRIQPVEAMRTRR